MTGATTPPAAPHEVPAPGPRWNGRAVTYLVLALVGLIGTWTYNIAAILARRDYVGDWIGSGPAVTSLTIDVLVAAVAAIVFMVWESRRLGMRRVWVYIVLIPLVALAFAFPLFLAMRERRLAERGLTRPPSGRT